MRSLRGSNLVKAGAWILGVVSTLCVAQLPGTFPTSKVPYTMHVYTNLLQVPTLVLTPRGELLQHPLQPQDFTIHIEGMRALHPVYANLAGKEALNITLLIDSRDTSPELLDALPEAFDTLLNNSLLPSDTVSVFAAGCSLVRSTLNLPASAPGLRTAVSRAVQAARQSQPDRRRPCLGDAAFTSLLTVGLRDVRLREGRPILLVLANTTPELPSAILGRLIEALTFTGTALFTVSTQPIRSPTMLRGNLPVAVSTEKNAFLETLALDSGGIGLSAASETLGKTLTDVLHMVRSRYLLEFPRPAEATAGTHLLRVSIDRYAAHALTSGVTAPIHDPTNVGSKEISSDKPLSTVDPVPSPDH